MPVEGCQSTNGQSADAVSSNAAPGWDRPSLLLPCTVEDRLRVQRLQPLSLSLSWP